MSKQHRFGNLPTHRHLRVAELVRRALAKLLSHGVPNEPELDCISVTVGEVRMSPDLRRATVYVLPLGGSNSEEVVGALNANRSEIRKQLNKSVNLKRSPALTFVSDSLFDQMDDMSRLFSRDDIKRDLPQADSPTK